MSHLFTLTLGTHIIQDSHQTLNLDTHPYTRYSPPHSTIHQLSYNIWTVLLNLQDTMASS